MSVKKIKELVKQEINCCVTPQITSLGSQVADLESLVSEDLTNPETAYLSGNSFQNTPTSKIFTEIELDNVSSPYTISGVGGARILSVNGSIEDIASNLKIGLNGPNAGTLTGLQVALNVGGDIVVSWTSTHTNSDKLLLIVEYV